MNLFEEVGSALDHIKTVSQELATALDALPDPPAAWLRMTGATFVAAGRRADGATVVANSGGWWTTATGESGPAGVLGSHESAAAALAALPALPDPEPDDPEPAAASTVGAQTSATVAPGTGTSAAAQRGPGGASQPGNRGAGTGATS